MSGGKQTWAGRGQAAWVLGTGLPLWACGGPVSCAPCIHQAIDVGSLLTNGALPTELRICVDGMCRLQPLYDTPTSGPGTQLAHGHAKPGTTMQELRIDLLRDGQVIRRAYGSNLAFPPTPRQSSRDCD